MQKYRPTPWRVIRASAFAVGALIMTTGAEAQISRDGTTDQIAADLIPDANGVFEIDGAFGIREGDNDEIVVHSMSQFNLAIGETARYMDSDAGLQASVATILTRVTGGSGSVLDGRIESLYPNADLFFVNPNGVFFGANFTIDVPKSFHSSTADFIDWEPGISIDTRTSTDIPSVTAAVPMAWRFLGAGPEKRIDVEGFTVDDTRLVADSEAFTFVGSELAFGTASVPVDINTNGRNFLAGALGDSGSAEGFFDFTLPFGGISISTTNGLIAGNIDLNGQLSTAGSGSRSGDIALLANNLGITGSLMTASTQLQDQNAGNIRLTAQSLFMDGLLDASGVGGDGRNIQIVASDRIDFASGTALRVGTVTDVRNSGQILIVGAGSRLTGSNVLFEVGTNAILGQGRVDISADIIDLQGFEIRASAGTGSGNNVVLNGRQIRLSGIGPNTIDVSGDASDAGRVFITATEFLDFRNMTINASASLGGDGGSVGFTVPSQAAVTSDANFSSLVDQSAPLPNFNGTFSGFMPTITANPPAIDPDPNATATGIFRDSTPGQGQQNVLLTPIADIYQINGDDGLRRIIDGDEFVIHSFDRFNLESSETARFTDNATSLLNVDAVFTRITGDQPSRIDGTIENLYEFADITFVNSNGVMFGDEFTLDTNASFLATTADSISFESGLTIDMRTPSPIPVGLELEVATRWNFLSAGPEKEILINGFAVVDNGPLADPDATLEFLGTDVTFNMQGSLLTFGRNLLAVAVGTSGGFDVDPLLTRAGLGATPNGDLTLNLQPSGASTIHTGGTSIAGGDFVLLGGTVEIVLNRVLTGGGSGDAGDIIIIADDFESGRPSPGTTILDTESQRSLAGSIVIDAVNSITFADSASIQSRAPQFGGGSGGLGGGDIQLIAGGQISGTLNLVADGRSGEDGGTVDLNADVINLQNLRIDTSTRGGGIPGDITITGRQINLDGQGPAFPGSILAFARESRASGGTVLINASETLNVQELIINASNLDGNPIGLSGDGGFVEINSPDATADAIFAVDVSSSFGNAGTFTGTAFPTAPTSRIIRDATSAINAGPIIPVADVYEISGANGFRRGPNDSIVVHSFSEFGLNSNETARFTDVGSFLTNTTTVLSRITGGQASQIDGTIESLYTNANLFFVNPNGIIFGTEFVLDTVGAFYASTADSILWDAGVSVDISSTAPLPDLTGANPLRWDFQSGGPTKRIEINGFDIIDNGPLALGGEFLSFVGSELSLTTNLNTQGRNLDFLTVGASGGSLDFDLQAIPLSAPEGTINIASVINTAVINGDVGDILLLGGDVTISGGLVTTNVMGGAGVSPRAGDIDIIVDNLTHTGVIATAAELAAGSIQIVAFDSATFANSILTAGVPGPNGLAGDITVSAGNSLTSVSLNVANEALGFRTSGGTVNLSGDSINLRSTRIGAAAPVGAEALSILITGRDIRLNGSTNGLDSIDVSSAGTADAGSVIINASESLEFENLTIDASNVGAGGGNGGFVEINSRFGTSDALFDVDVSASSGAPGTLTGSFFGASPPPNDLPDPPSETTDVIASLDQIISFTANETTPIVADDSLFGATDDFAVTEPSTESDADSTEDGNDEEELATTSDRPDPDADLPAVGSDIASAQDTEEVTDANETSAGEEDPNIPAALFAALEEDQPEASVAAADATSTSKKGSTTIPGISLFSRAAERAPLMPRTCDVLAKTGSGSRLLARNPRRQPISSEDWLLAFDQSGDQLLAMNSESLPSVGAQASGDPAASNLQGEIQQAFAAAAIAIRGDRYDDAASRFLAAINSLEQAGDDPGATQALLAFAQLQFQDGRFGGAGDTLRRALALAEKSGDENSIAKVRQSLGNALVGMGDLSGAEEELTRGLGVALAAEDKGPAASMLNDLGNSQAAKRDFKSALWAYERAANLASDLGRFGDEARALAGAARVAVDVSRLDDAWRLLERADSIRGNARSARARASLAIHVGRTFAELANVTTDRRADALTRASAAFESAIQDAKASGDTYTLALANLNLGSLYKDEQHHSEALYLTRLARKDATRIGAPELIYRAHWQEGQILWSAHRVRDALASHRRAIEILEETKPVTSDGYGASEANFMRSVGGVYRDHVDLLLQSSELATSSVVSRQLIAEARETLESLKGAEIRDYFEDECIASVRKEKRTIENGVAIVHTVILPDRLELLVTLPTGIERFSTKISAANLMRMIDRFRTEVQNPRSTAYQPLARRLFDIVVAPYSKRLEEIGITTLIFVPDGRLRTLPFVALHDGVGFLGERYATATTLSLNLLANRALTTESGAPVLAGVSESVQGFVALEAVDEELKQIQGLGGGELLLNQEFTLDRVKLAVAKEVPRILHLATHAVFTGNPDTSFLLTFDGRVGFDQLADVVGMTQTEGAPLDLLVLSACETAVGNDRAGLGFTGSAIRAGARSAVGSLWPIADEAAGQFMVEFYSNLQLTEATKADALQQAQAHLRQDTRYAHPAYWAPFTLVNDWL